jgi:hypothetical protein
MAQIASPDDVVRLFSACEAAYADATEKGYADSPDVIAAVADLKAVYRALVLANGKLAASKGSVEKTVAGLRVHRTSRAFHDACINLHAAIEKAAAENHLNNRCLTVSQRAI